MAYRSEILAFLLRHKRWLVVASAIPLFEVVTAFGTAPDTLTNAIEQETIIADIALPEPVGRDSGNFDFWREEKIQRGDTLASLLERLGVGAAEIPAILSVCQDHSVMGRLVAGHTVLARVTSGGLLLSLRYLPDDQRLISIERGQDGFLAKEEAVELDSQIVMRAGEIRSSLFGATDAVDVPDSVATQLAEIFAGDIDFHRDLRQGDRFTVVYETLYHAGSTVRTGRLLAAEFTNQGKTYRAVYFRDPQGRESYFTPEGQSMKRAFLRSPMPFTRISSGFSSARYHPVLKEWRAHKGIDYAAPTGTPVRAVADGVVDTAGRQRGFGNLVVLKHQGPYSTAYGHLSRFASGMRRGARVKQGDVIAYVGSTGLATGPHLHYEFRVNNVQKNPLALKLPVYYPLEPRYREAFAAATTPNLNRLELLSGRSLAAAD